MEQIMKCLFKIAMFRIVTLSSIDLRSPDAASYQRDLYQQPVELTLVRQEGRPQCNLSLKFAW
jgi:hypothetical protein